MRTRSSSNLIVEFSTTPKRRNRRRSKQRVEPFSLEETSIVTMVDQRTMADLLQAPTEGYGDAIVIPTILAENFELKHGLLNLVTSKQFYRFEKEDPHAHIRWFNKITSTIKYKDVPNSSIKLMLFPFSIEGAARIWLEKEPPRSILTWEDLVSKFINQFFPPSKTSDSEMKFKLSNNVFNDVIAKCCSCAVTSALDAMFKQHQVTPAPASVKVVEESCVTCGGAHSYRQCPATDGNIFSDGPSIPMPPPFINPEEDERAEETLTDPEIIEYTIKVPPPLVQKPSCPLLKIYEMPKRDPLYPNIPYPSRMYKEKQQDKDEIQIHKFWQMFKQLHINISLADALILIPKYQKMLKALLSNKEKLLELANIPLNENCSAIILKKLPEKLGDPGKFLIPCSFSELNCKALADLGASINLMPLSVWKKLGLSELISTRMTLELATGPVCTPAGIARDVFVPVGRFTFPTDFVIVDYESDPRVPLILGRPFLRTARALIDVHGEELILCDGDERLILNMKHGTSSYSNKHQRESINMIDIYNISYEDYLEDLFANEKITNHLISKLLVDELDSTGSSSFLPHFLESDSVLYEDFSKDYNPPLSDHELPFHIEIPGSGTLLSFSSENEEKVFNPGILISKGVHSLLPELSHRDSKAFKVINIFENPMEIFPCSYREDIRVLDVPCVKSLVTSQTRLGCVETKVATWDDLAFKLKQ
ncbi:reverse transcriptase domain-containing protein [Tanacetum coccineum]